MLPREALSGEALLGLAERLRKTLAASQDARGKVAAEQRALESLQQTRAAIADAAVMRKGLIENGVRLRARYSSPFGRVLHLSLANAQRLWVAVCDLGFAALWHADSHDLLSAAPLPLAAPLAAACACELPPSEGAEETVAGVAVLESTGAVSLLGVVWNGEQASVHIRASAPGVLPHDARFPRAPTLLRTRPGISHIVAAQGQRVVSLDKASLAMAWTFDLQDAGLVEPGQRSQSHFVSALDGVASGLSVFLGTSQGLLVQVHAAVRPQPRDGGRSGASSEPQRNVNAQVLRKLTAVICRLPNDANGLRPRDAQQPLVAPIAALTGSEATSPPQRSRAMPAALAPADLTLMSAAMATGAASGAASGGALPGAAASQSSVASPRSGAASAGVTPRPPPQWRCSASPTRVWDLTTQADSGGLRLVAGCEDGSLHVVDVFAQTHRVLLDPGEREEGVSEPVVAVASERGYALSVDTAGRVRSWDLGGERLHSSQLLEQAGDTWRLVALESAPDAPLWSLALLGSDKWTLWSSRALLARPVGAVAEASAAAAAATAGPPSPAPSPNATQ